MGVKVCADCDYIDPATPELATGTDAGSTVCDWHRRQRRKYDQMVHEARSSNRNPRPYLPTPVPASLRSTARIDAEAFARLRELSTALQPIATSVLARIPAKDRNRHPYTLVAEMTAIILAAHNEHENRPRPAKPTSAWTKYLLRNKTPRGGPRPRRQ